MQPRYIASLLVFSFLSTMAVAQDSGFALSGSISHMSFASYLESGPPEARGFLYGSATTLETSLDARGDGARAEARLETGVLTGSAALALLGLPAGSGALISQLDSQSAIVLRLKTLSVKLMSEYASIQAGRQVVNYGRGQAFSPVDIFASADFSGFSPGRRGVDALRLVVPLGDLSSLDAVAAPSVDPSRGIYALRARSFAFGVDGAGLVSHSGDEGRWTAGFEFKADAGVGLYGEAACLIPDDGSAPALRALAGTDASIGDFVIIFEYYYNGLAAGGPGPLVPAQAFPAAHNLYIAPSYKLSDYVRLQASALYEPEYGIASGNLVIAIDAAQSATISAYVRAASGSFAARTQSFAADAGIMLAISY